MEFKRITTKISELASEFIKQNERNLDNNIKPEQFTANELKTNLFYQVTEQTNYKK